MFATRGGSLTGRLLIVPPPEVESALQRHMGTREFAQRRRVAAVRTAPAGAIAFVAPDGHSTAVIPNHGLDYVRSIATHEVLHFAEHRREAAESYRPPRPQTVLQLAAIYRSEYVIERARGELSNGLGWQPTALDRAGWRLDGTDADIERAILSARGRGAVAHAWQTAGDFIRMWVMALGGRAGWAGASALPARPFRDWPWVRLSASLKRAYGSPEAPLRRLDSVVYGGLDPLLGALDAQLS